MNRLQIVICMQVAVQCSALVGSASAAASLSANVDAEVAQLAKSLSSLSKNEVESKMEPEVRFMQYVVTHDYEALQKFIGNLREQGGDALARVIKSKTPRGLTALHMLAADKGEIFVVKKGGVKKFIVRFNVNDTSIAGLLLGNEVPIDERDSFGYKAFDWAMHRGNRELANYLARYGRSSGTLVSRPEAQAKDLEARSSKSATIIVNNERFTVVRRYRHLFGIFDDKNEVRITSDVSTNAVREILKLISDVTIADKSSNKPDQAAGKKAIFERLSKYDAKILEDMEVVADELQFDGLQDAIKEFKNKSRGRDRD